MASSHPAWSYWSDATVLDNYAMTTTTTTTSLCVAKHGILVPEYTQNLTASGGEVPQTPCIVLPNLTHKSPPL